MIDKVQMSVLGLFLAAAIALSATSLASDESPALCCRSVESAWQSSCYIRVTLTIEVSTEDGAVSTFGCWSGSGTLLSPSSGLVLTNFHVADSTEKITARSYRIYFPWRDKPFQGKFIRSDRSKDLALLLLEGDFSEASKHCQDIILAPRDSEPKVLTEVWALGSPFGMRHGASRGIISGLNRIVRLQLRYANPSIPMPPKVTLKGMIQTDAAVNPGNSGGGLFDRNGVMLGVVNSGQSFANSIGFAIPANKVHDFLAPSIKKK